MKHARQHQMFINYFEGQWEATKEISYEKSYCKTKRKRIKVGRCLTLSQMGKKCQEEWGPCHAQKKYKRKRTNQVQYTKWKKEVDFEDRSV